MSFQPMVPLAGVAGWRFLERTQATQQAAFEKGPELKRDIAYFEANIGKIASVADLIADRRLLKVALGAFGLEGEIDKKAFLRKILEEGTEKPTALANRMVASGMKEFAEAFGFGNVGGSRVKAPGFTPTIVAAYKTRAFEAAVGEANNDLRLAMNFRREIANLSKGAEGGSWFTVLASKPMRAVFEKVFNLPKEFGRIDVDRQRDVLREKTRAMFGTDKLTAFADPANVQKVIDRFLARAQIDAGPGAASPAASALSLLQGMSRGGSQGLSNLLASRR